jgi:dienelactone hydrolase
MLKNIRSIAVAILFSCAATAYAEEQVTLLSELNESVEMIKVGTNLIGRDVKLETTIFKPNGDGPFPIIFINHGKDPTPTESQPRSRMTVLAAEFVARGYVVVFPNARGFSKSSGSTNTYKCNIYSEVVDTGKDLRVLIDEFKSRPYVNKTQIVVMGQSFGGLNVLATIVEPIEGLALAVNFAGGLNYGDWCNWEYALYSSFEKLGKGAKHDSVWFYGSNDSLFSVDLVKKGHQLYNANGQRAELVNYGSFRADAHAMFGSLAGFNDIWWPILKPKLKEKGLPVEVVNPTLQTKTQVVTPSEFAAASDFDKLPANLNKACRTFYENLIKNKVTPSAFVISEEGNCGGMGDYDLEPEAWAMASCKRKPNSKNCKLYFHNGQVVWPKQ